MKTEIRRKTKETDVALTLGLDGTGAVRVSTGIGFFDHMLTAFFTHSGIDADLTVKGDLEVDCHHTVEDAGIVIGQALLKAADRTKIERFGHAIVPMDEALCECAVDFSGRGFCVYKCKYEFDKAGDLDVQTIGEFFRAVAANAGITAHLNVPYGDNDHHKAEASFKAFAYAIRQALRPSGRCTVVSTKGVL